MFGFTIPALFLTTLLGLINLYILDRILFAYYTRRPPDYDEKIARKILSLMTPAPFLMFGLGYWAMTNPQLFEQTTREFKINKHEIFWVKHRWIPKNFISVGGAIIVSTIFLIILEISRPYLTNEKKVENALEDFKSELS